MKKVIISFLFILSFGGFYQLSVSADGSEIIMDEGNVLIEDTNFESDYFEDGVTPMGGDPYYTWSITSKTVTGTTYGSYKVCGSARTPSTLTCGGSSSLSSTYSGELAVPLKTLGLSVGATLNKEDTYSHSWSKTFTTVGRYEAIVRPAYTNYKVIQTRYMHLDGQKYKTSTTKTVYVKKYSHLNYSWRTY